MVKHYSYRMDHDVGFAPYVAGTTCILCGCKSSTIERWAKPGSWVVGVGGNKTGKPDALIYAMRVEYTPTFSEFTKRWSAESRRHRGIVTNPDMRVLVSEHFYYFGDRAVKLPPRLAHLVINAQGCKSVATEDALTLQEFLASLGQPGVYGRPNNTPVFSEAEITQAPTKRCRPSRERPRC